MKELSEGSAGNGHHGLRWVFVGLVFEHIREWRSKTCTSVSRHVTHSIVLLGHVQDPRCGFGMARFFSTCQKYGWRWLGFGDVGCAYQLQCTVLVVQLCPTLWAVEKPDLWESCRLLEPLPAHGPQNAPGQKPTHGQPSHTHAAHSLTVSRWTGPQRWSDCLMDGTSGAR